MAIKRRLSTAPSKRKNVSPMARRVMDVLLANKGSFIFYDTKKCHISMKDGANAGAVHMTDMCGFIACGLVTEYKRHHYRIAD